MTLRRWCWVVAWVVAGCGGTKEPLTVAPPPPSHERMVLDLVAARPLCHLYLDGALVLDGSAVGFWKYAEGRAWVPGLRPATQTGLAGYLRLPVEGGGDRRLLVRLRTPPGQALSVFVNERPAGNLAISDGGGTVELNLPAALLHPGDNQVRLHFRVVGELDGKRAAAAVERVVLGAPGGLRDPGTPPRLGQAYGLGGDVRRALGAERPARFVYYLTLPSSPVRLRLALGSQSASPGAPPIEARIAVTVDGKPGEQLLSRPARALWQEADVDLARWAGQAVRLDLELRGGGGAFAEPRLVTDAPAAALAPARPFDHLIVWVIDSLRRDRAVARVTPTFARVLNEGLSADRASAPANFSLASHATILAGVYPSVHAALGETGRVADRVPLVSERLKAQGRATALVSAVGYVSEKWGLGRGWDLQRNFVREGRTVGPGELWKTAKAFLQAHVGGRTFLYVVSAGPHVPYTPTAERLRAFWPRAYGGPLRPAQTAQQLGAIKRGQLHLDAEDRQYLEALYEAAAADDDAALGELIADVDALGLTGRTALLVLSDHGEELFDHGSVGHGHSVYEELVAVPIGLHAPGITGRVHDVELVDVAPTLLDLAGAPPWPELQGQSMLTMQPGTTMPRPLTSRHGDVRALRLGRYKLNLGAGRAQLFDLDEDPHEQRPIEPATLPIAQRALRDAFLLEQTYETEWHKTVWGAVTDPRPAWADELE